MYLSFGLLKLLLLITATTISTGRSICKTKTSLAKSGSILTYDVMEMGRYMVRTTMRTNSMKVQHLIASLALNKVTGDIQYKSKSFTAVLQPKSLKKVRMYLHASNHSAL